MLGKAYVVVFSVFLMANVVGTWVNTKPLWLLIGLCLAATPAATSAPIARNMSSRGGVVGGLA
jgi:hypothetical protein